MRRIPVALITVAGTLVVAACSGRDATAPRGIAADQANYATLPGPATTCDFNAIKTATRAYFTSNQDSAYDYVSAMQKAYDGGATTTATDIGWKIGRLVAKERLKSATTTGSAGRIFLLDVMQCMSNLSGGSSPYPKLSIPDTFAVHAAEILASGVWEVRGGPAGRNSQFPAAGRVIDNTSHVRAFGQPRWGVEPVVIETWPGATEYAVYGYPTNIGSLVIGSAGNINTNEVEANSFELGTIPDATSKSGLRVGVCIHQDVNSGIANRILHSNSEILDISNITQLCDFSNTSFTASIQSQPAWYASALHRVGTFLAPKSAFAQFGDCNDCIGGLPSGWSPFSPSGVTAASVVLSLDTQPADAAAVPVGGATNDQVVVHAKVNGLDVPGVKIDSIAVYNNSGSPAGAIVTASNLPVFTNKNGQATVQFAIGKPGGYIIIVSATLDGSRTQSVTSSMFHIKNP